jgi:hypothetical protein
MNETVLNTLAEVAITFAGLSGVAVVFRLRSAFLVSYGTTGALVFDRR